MLAPLGGGPGTQMLMRPSSDAGSVYPTQRCWASTHTNRQGCRAVRYSWEMARGNRRTLTVAVLGHTGKGIGLSIMPLGGVGTQQEQKSSLARLPNLVLGYDRCVDRHVHDTTCRSWDIVGMHTDMPVLPRGYYGSTAGL